MNKQWAIEQLKTFIASAQWRPSGGSFGQNAASQDQVIAQAQVVEQIFGRVIPDWKERVAGRDKNPDRWSLHRDVAQRALTQLEREQEIVDNLGESTPDLNAAQLHYWVWDGARSLWQTSHFREAVSAAAVKVNAETQNKVKRVDVSEGKLFQEAFSLKEPELNKARLRIVPNDGSETYRSTQEGATPFAVGCYRAIRNPAAHIPLGELGEPEALEQLAAFSILSRWVDAASLYEAT